MRKILPFVLALAITALVAWPLRIGFSFCEPLSHRFFGAILYVVIFLALMGVVAITFALTLQIGKNLFTPVKRRRIPRVHPVDKCVQRQIAAQRERGPEIFSSN